MDFNEIFLLNFLDEIWDVQAAVGQAPPLKTPARHCSALVRHTYRDLFMAHDTWSGFQTMRRQYKTYQMDTSVSMSSYAGRIASGDDWYITSNELAIQETTNLIWNTTLSQLYVVPKTASEFIRVMAATYLASSGKDWVSYFAFNNSGTYNNQYMVVAMHRFQGSKPLKDDTLWVAEQIPGNVTSADVTDVLREQGYWASYNIPYFRNIYEVSGYPQAVEREGLIWSYNSYARAEIFRREAPKVHTLEDMMAIMRFNNFSVDPLSLIPNCSKATNGVCDPSHSAMLTIASRGDLNPYGGEAQYGVAYNWLGQRNHGATDTKIAARSELYSGVDGLVMAGHVICGPTNLVNGVHRPFKWSATNFSNLRPSGVPDEYDFQWQRYSRPYPPHGYYDGYPDIGIVLGSMFGAVVVVSIILAVVIKGRLAAKPIDQYSEKAPLAVQV